MVEEHAVNAGIFQALEETGVHLWQVASRLGYGEFRLQKMLKHDLPERQRRAILESICALSKNRGEKDV